jgi:hypothetical protein
MASSSAQADHRKGNLLRRNRRRHDLGLAITESRSPCDDEPSPDQAPSVRR